MSLQNLYNTIIETAIMMYQNETGKLKKIPDIMIEMNNLLKVIVGKSLDEAQALCDVMLRLEESYRTGDKLAVGDILYLEICSWILQYAQDNNIAIGDEQKSAIEEFVTSIEKEYKTDVDITYINYYVSFRNMYNKFFIILIVILLMLAVVDIVITIKDHHYVHRGLRYVTYATLAAAIMTGVLPLFLFIQGRYKHLNIKPVYFYNMFVDVINKSLYSFMAVSVFFILVSAGLIIATVILRKKAEKGHN